VIIQEFALDKLIKLKKSQLKRIIKEELKKLQNEQVLSAITPRELLSDFANYMQQNNIQVDWRCLPQVRQWLISIFTLQPFQNSPNPNQPCQYIQNKINQLQNWITNHNNSGGNPNSAQLANKQCKLQFFIPMLSWAQQYTHFNC
jgi:hypothetical protein